MDVFELLQKGHTLMATYNTGGKFNTFTSAFMSELIEVLSIAKKERNVRFLVIRGKDNFGTGADIKELYGSIRSRAGMEKYFGLMRSLYTNILEFDKVLISVVDKIAFGAHLELLLLSDINISDSNARFGAPGGKIGVFPPILVSIGQQIIGYPLTKRLAILGDEISAEEAKHFGLIYESGNPDSLLEEVLKRSSSMAPSSIYRMKRLLRRDFKDKINSAFDYLIDQATSDEAAEGITSFITRDTPSWARQH